MIEDYGFYLLVFAMAGSLAGIMGGLLGIGGGVITVPVMFTIFGYLGLAPEWHMHMAVGTSLAVILFSNSSSALAHFRRGGVEVGYVRAMGWVFAMGALLGSLFASTLKTDQMIIVFAGLIGLVGLKMILPLDNARLGGALPRGFSGSPAPFGIGFFSAIVGIGGGSMSVPYMTLFGMPIKTAVGTSSLLGLLISIAGGLGFIISGLYVEGLPPYSVGFVHMPSLVILAITASLCAPLGARLAHDLPPRALSIIFGLFLLLALWRMLTGLA